jgi:hypothetical protein
MYTPRTLVEAISNASIHHLALQNREFGHTYDRSRALVRTCALVVYPESSCSPLPERRVLRYDLVVKTKFSMSYNRSTAVGT